MGRAHQGKRRHRRVNYRCLSNWREYSRFSGVATRLREKIPPAVFSIADEMIE
jgi:hypothetical protein